MSALPATSSSTTSSTTRVTNNKSSLKSTDFVKFLVTQLQNQDPLQPTSSDQMLSQMSQIGQLQASTDLQTSIASLVLQNQVGAASSLIGKQVTGTDEFSNNVSGLVNSVKVNNNSVDLQLDSGKSVNLAKVLTITAPTGAATTTPAA